MATYRSDSHLATTPVNSKYTEYYEPNAVYRDRATRVVELTEKHAGRPDVLAHELYGNARLWWVFVHMNPNKIKDPVRDFVPGKKLLVPISISSSNANGTL